LASVGSAINAANANAKAGTTGVPAPGGDSVSAFVMALFAAHAQAYQAAGAQAASYHDLFVQALRASAGAYARAEDINVALQKTSGLGSVPGQNSAGHLIAKGVNGAAGHLIDNGASAAAGAAQHGGVNGPPPAGGAPAAPSGGNSVAAGPDVSGGDGHATAGPQGAGGGGNDVGGGPAAATNGGGGGGGDIADPRGAGGGAVGASVPAAWGPPFWAAPVGPLVPGSATPPVVPPVMAGGYPAAAGLAGLAGLGAGGFSGDSPAIGDLGGPAAPPVSAAAASPAAEPATPTAPKEQPLQQTNPLHQGNPAHQGDASHPQDGDHDIAAVPLFLPPLRLPSLRGLRGKLRLGLRDKDEWHKELREAAIKKPWGREELLGVLGLRPPGH
jgi:hypothetical protein